MCRFSWNIGTSNSWNPLGLSKPVMRLLYHFIRSFMSGLYCGYVFLKQDFLYAGSSEKSKLDTFSILWNKTLFISKHCLCIIFVYSDVLIPVLSLFVIRRNYCLKIAFAVVVLEKRVQCNTSSFTSSTACYLKYTMHCASLSASMDSSRWQLICFWSCSHWPFNIFCHMSATSYEFYHSTTESAPVHLTSTFQQLWGTLTTAAGSPQQ